MNYQGYQTQYPRYPPIYDNGRSFDLDQHSIPLLYHHQPSSPNDSPSMSPASGTNSGQHDILMGQGYPSSPYQPAQGLGQGFPSIAGQGYGTSRGPQSFESDMRQGQYMPTPSSRTHPHPPSSDFNMNVDDYINFSSDGDHSPTSLPSTSHSRQMQDPPRPSDQETEAYLRKSIPIADGKPVNLWSLPDTSSKTPKISDMIKLAIWGSRNHQLTLRQIYDEIEDRFPHLKEAQDKPWQRSIRHNLSLKAMFVREERPQSDPGKGYYWTLNTAMGEGNKRDRKRKRDGQNIKDEEEDTDFSSESQGYPDAPSPSTSHRSRPSQQRPGNAHDAMYMPGHPQQGMMHGQVPYIAPPSLMFNQTGTGGQSYNPGMGHPQNIPFQSGHANPGFPSSPNWGTQPHMNPQTGMFVGPGPIITGQGHYQQQQQQQAGGPSHRRNPTGGMGTRPQQQQPGLHPHAIPMQGDFMSSTGGAPHRSTRSSRRPHSDTSPEDDEDERARSGPRPRSGNRS